LSVTPTKPGFGTPGVHKINCRVGQRRGVKP
jgi:hypothetical protein